MKKSGDTTHQLAQKQGSQSAPSLPNRPRPRTSLRFPLLLQLVSFVALVTLLTGGIVGYVITNTARETLRQEILNKNLIQAELAAQNASNYIKAIQAHVQVFASRPDVRQAVLNNAPEQVQVALASFVQIQSFLTAAGIYDAQGIQRVISTAGAATIGQSFMDRDYMLQVIATGQPYLSAPLVSRTTGKATVVYAVPILDDQGKLRGILTGGISLAALSDAMVKIGYGVGTHASIIDKRDNLVIADLLPEHLVTLLQVKDEIAKGLLTGENNAIETVGGMGEKELVGFASVSGLPWGVIVATPSSIALAAIDTLTRHALLYTGIAILCAAVLGAGFMFSITRPLARLRNASRKLATGELTHRVHFTQRNEIGELGQAFDQMAERLSTTLVSRDALAREVIERKQAEVALEQYRDHLEELVKERTKKLEDTQEKLVASEKLATLGQFSGNISHELRNPLGVIDSSVYYLKTKLKDADEKVHEHLDRIKLSVSNSTAIIESLLNLTRMKSPELTKLDLTAVTRDAVDTSKLPDTVISKLDFPEGEVLVDGDNQQLRMAFKNIIKNANQAMGSGGTLTVIIRTSVDGQAEVSFNDTGSGIAAEDMRKVFQPLFSRKAKGIGLGLAITKMIIEKHGGAIEAKSELGKGATFVIQLPLHADKDKES